MRLGVGAQPVELRLARQCCQLDLLLGANDVHDGVDQRQVRKRLREVAEVSTRAASISSA